MCYEIVYMNKGFTLVELLIVVAIMGILSAVGIVSYNGFIDRSQIAATRTNHTMIVNLVNANSIRCRMGDEVDYLDTAGNSQSFNCPTAIDQFIRFMNDHVYGMNLLSPYGTPNGSWCRVNVTNCSPPGYMTACPSNPDQLGYLSIFRNIDNQIVVCSNLEFRNNSIIYLENIISFE